MSEEEKNSVFNMYSSNLKRQNEIKRMISDCESINDTIKAKLEAETDADQINRLCDMLEMNQKNYKKLQEEWAILLKELNALNEKYED